MLSNIHKNIMGTISFEAKFPGMRLSQDFIVYPVTKPGSLMIQSDTRIGTIELETGWVTMSKPHKGGAHGRHLVEAQRVVMLSPVELELLRTSVRKTASSHAGSNGMVYVNNSMAGAV